MQEGWSCTIILLPKTPAGSRRSGNRGVLHGIFSKNCCFQTILCLFVILSFSCLQCIDFPFFQSMYSFHLSSSLYLSFSLFFLFFHSLFHSFFLSPFLSLSTTFFPSISVFLFSFSLHFFFISPSLSPFFLSQSPFFLPSLFLIFFLSYFLFH